MTSDARELRQLSQDLGRVSAKVLPDVEKVVFKGSMNIKKRMQEELRSSMHFKSIASSVDFEVETTPNGVSAEIGPKHGAGEPGNLANVAYFGTSRGGGTVDFMKPLAEEAPRFEKAIGDVLKNVL